MIIRVRCAEGNFRFDVNKNDSLMSLAVMIGEKVGADPKMVSISKDPAGKQPLNLNEKIEKLGFSQGDLIFSTVLGEKKVLVEENLAKEDSVDMELSKLKGTIQKKRERDNSMKISELPIEPYDTAYLEERKIKHMSFHAYIRKLQNEQKNSGMTANTYLLQDEVEEFVKKTKRSGGSKVALKDLPPPIILQRQTFRMVDYVEFETSSMVDLFLQFWREKGHQRFGYLYGRYERHEDVPLGIKAVVSFIYEPPQNGMRDGLEVLEDGKKEDLVNSIAASFGLVKVGMIYTDLIDDGTGKGKVLYKRNANTFFLSCGEVIYSSLQQLAHPSYTRYSQNKQFGSKFVTVVVSGDEKGNVSLSAYQVSNQSMALVSSKCCQATDQPAYMMVCESNEETIVPEIMYRGLNEFNTTVLHKANPSFPVDLLLVNVGHGFPVNPKPLFVCQNPFKHIENRTSSKNFNEFKNHIKFSNFKVNQFSDFHFLLFIAEMEVMDASSFGSLLEAIKTNNQVGLDHVLKSESWKNMSLVVDEISKQGGDRAQFTSQLSLLKEMGFVNEEENLNHLRRFKGKVEDVINFFMSKQR